MECIRSSLCFNPLVCPFYGLSTFGQGIGRLLSCNFLDCCKSEEKRGVVIVTGANRNVGYFTAKALLQQGHRLIILCRNKKKGMRAVNRLKARTGNHMVELGLLMMHSFQVGRPWGFGIGCKVRILINNAGAISNHAMDINHLGHFALSIGLLSRIIEGEGVIVNVASCAHWTANINEKFIGEKFLKNVPGRRGSSWEEYCSSKAANVLFTKVQQALH
eukprot:jgi/Bigna1/146139/aug1.109_g20847